MSLFSIHKAFGLEISSGDGDGDKAKLCLAGKILCYLR